MKIKDYIFAILAGFVLVLLWYGQFAFSLAVNNDAGLELYMYPFIPAICLVLLLKHKQFKYVFAKIGLFLVSSFCFLFASREYNLHYRILNAFSPGYGRMSAGGGFALMIQTFLYLIINGIAVLVSLFFCKPI
jgi:hypothetical protein